MNYLNADQRLDILAASGHLIGSAIGVEDLDENKGWKILEDVLEQVTMKYTEKCIQKCIQMMAIGASINDGETLDDVTLQRTEYHVKEFVRNMERGMAASGIKVE